MEIYVNKALSLDPTDLLTLKNCARVWLLGGFALQARDLLVQATRLYPFDREAQAMLQSLAPTQG